MAVLTRKAQMPKPHLARANLLSNATDALQAEGVLLDQREAVAT
eukprot:CAMPEP_0117503618 /NCGR_PEP_ID=MMETSP0784-20121206/24423_1 /TAXON_ID=39447 /ORGANISM="" /LENGTH=43 /DNA_ID= /DNA_START= /DNA_END= /DNA_ORIENTATION=